jgi:hypothetical protein
VELRDVVKVSGERARDATPGNADGCEKKGVAGVATQKLMKTKHMRGLIYGRLCGFVEKSQRRVARLTIFVKVNFVKSY